jgi:hypothetical protein
MSVKVEDGLLSTELRDSQNDLTSLGSLGQIPELEHEASLLVPLKQSSLGSAVHGSLSV